MNPGVLFLRSLKDVSFPSASDDVFILSVESNRKDTGLFDLTVQGVSRGTDSVELKFLLGTITKSDQVTPDVSSGNFVSVLADVVLTDERWMQFQAKNVREFIS